MRLFHVSEENDIEIFYPRIPDREDLSKKTGLIWAIDEKRLPNFLTPRDCPRVTYHVGKDTEPADCEKFFSSATISHAVILENRWYDKIKRTILYLYEFEETDFELQDEIAGYYVAKTVQIPVAKHQVTDLFSALFERRVEVRLVDNLWDICEEIQKTTLNWSMCRMRNAQPKG